MPLVIDICPGKLVIVALLVVGGASQRSQFLFRFAIITLSDVSISQADSYRVIRSAQIFGFGEVTFGQIKVMSCQENVGGFDKIICGDRRSFANARLSKGQRYFLLGIGKLALADKEFCELNAHV